MADNKRKRVRRVRKPRRDRADMPLRVKPASRSTRRTKDVSEEELREDYEYVIKDLSRIFYLAAIMFAILIAANIAFQYL